MAFMCRPVCVEVIEELEGLAIEPTLTFADARRYLAPPAGATETHVDTVLPRTLPRLRAGFRRIRPGLGFGLDPAGIGQQSNAGGEMPFGANERRPS